MNVVDRLLAAIASAQIADATDIWAPTAEVDATVPEWRFPVHGDEMIRAEFAKWYNYPITLEGLTRTPLPTGELVEFTLSWVEEGVPHGGHQAHVLHVERDRVIQHTVWCGGRWPASLMAEMEEAARANA